MRIVFLAAAAAAVLMGCGGKVESTADDANGDSSIMASCVYGSLGSIDGNVTKIVSNGNSVFYTDFVDQNDSSIGVLSQDQTIKTLSNNPYSWSTDIAPYEDGVAAVLINDFGSLGARGTEIRFWNGGGTPQTIETVDGVNAAVFGLTTDGDLSLVWYKYDTTSGGTFETWNEGPIVSTAAPTDFEGGDFLTDGKSYFGMYSNSPQLDFGQLAVNGASELPFSSSDSASGLSDNLIGVDSNNVYYALQFGSTGATAPQPGQILSADRTTGQTTDLGAKAGITYGQPVVFRLGEIYSLGQGENGPASAFVSRFDLASGETTALVPSSAVAANDNPGVMTQDRCGIVYTVQHGTTTNVFRIQP